MLGNKGKVLGEMITRPEEAATWIVYLVYNNRKDKENNKLELDHTMQNRSDELKSASIR